MASARHPSPRRSPISSRPWAAPTTPSSTAAACSSSCAVATRRHKSSRSNLPSRRCSIYGRPFAEIFAAVNGDFYKIDPMLFSPAAVIVSNLDTGSSFHAGELAPDDRRRKLPLRPLRPTGTRASLSSSRRKAATGMSVVSPRRCAVARRLRRRHLAAALRLRHRARQAASTSRALMALCLTPCSCARSQPARSSRSRSASASCTRCV